MLQEAPPHLAPKKRPVLKKTIRSWKTGRFYDPDPRTLILAPGSANAADFSATLQATEFGPGAADFSATQPLSVQGLGQG